MPARARVAPHTVCGDALGSGLRTRHSHFFLTYRASCNFTARCQPSSLREVACVTVHIVRSPLTTARPSTATSRCTKRTTQKSRGNTTQMLTTQRNRGEPCSASWLQNYTDSHGTDAVTSAQLLGARFCVLAATFTGPSDSRRGTGSTCTSCDIATQSEIVCS